MSLSTIESLIVKLLLSLIFGVNGNFLLQAGVVIVILGSK